MMFHALYDIVTFCRVIVEGRGGGSVDHMNWDLCTAHALKQTFNILKLLEREPLKYCKCDGKVTFTRPFLILQKVTFG